MRSTSTAAVTPARPGAFDRRQRATLGAAMLGFFVVALDAQIVNVALPDIGADLGGGLSGLQWLVTGYTLTFSALILCAGTLSERIGARQAYALGMIVFALASAACGLTPTLGVLVAARIVQGAGAALITPPSLALIREGFTDSIARTRNRLAGDRRRSGFDGRRRIRGAHHLPAARWVPRRRRDRSDHRLRRRLPDRNGGRADRRGHCPGGHRAAQLHPAQRPQHRKASAP